MCTYVIVTGFAKACIVHTSVAIMAYVRNSDITLGSHGPPRELYLFTSHILKAHVQRCCLSLNGCFIPIPTCPYLPPTPPAHPFRSIDSIHDITGLKTQSKNPATSVLFMNLSMHQQLDPQPLRCN